MSSKEFIDRLLKAGEKYTGTGGAGVIGRVLIEFGLHRYVAGHDFWSFWKPVANDNEIDVIGDELKARLQQAGSNDTPVLGVKVTIKKDVLSRDEPYKADLQEFVPAWQKDSFNMVVDAINTADLPIGEVFYGQVQYKANPHFVKQGEAGKTETDQNDNPRYPSIRVPVQKFTNEQAAKSATGGSSSGGSNANSQWSDKALATFNNDIKALESNADEVFEWFDKATKGIPFNNDSDNFPLPVPATPPKVKKYIADIWDIETGDVDVMIDLAVPI